MGNPVGPLLHYRAGPRARERIRAAGVTPATIRAVFGPASGPRWIVFAGLDRALIESGLLAGRTVLAGSSAGAWRMMAFASPRPLLVHRRLLDAYIGQVFTRRDRAPSVSLAYRAMLDELFAENAPTLLAADLVIHTARLRGVRSRPLLAMALAAVMAMHRIGGHGTGALFEPVAFDTRPTRAMHGFRGRRVALTAANLIDAALASGTVPLYLEAVRDPQGAPRGAYVDGGLTDYHLNQRYGTADQGVLLLVHYQREIVPRWMDGRGNPATPPGELTADVLLVHPSPSFVDRLPGGRAPERDDFLHFVDDPGERIRRWQDAASLSETLGEALERDLASGRIPDALEPL